jgi:hypothetical protein
MTPGVRQASFPLVKKPLAALNHWPAMSLKVWACPKVLLDVYSW